MEESDAAKTDKEYAAQFLGFVPSSFVDDLSEDSIELVTNSLEFMQQNIVKTYPENVNKLMLTRHLKRLRLNIRKIEKNYLKNLDPGCAPTFSKFLDMFS